MGVSLKEEVLEVTPGEEMMKLLLKVPRSRDGGLSLEICNFMSIIHRKKGTTCIILTSDLLSNLQREFKNENNSGDVSVMVICFYILGLRMRKAI